MVIKKYIKIVGFVFLFCLFYPKQAAAVYEVSLGFSFSRSNFSGESFTWTRRWGSSFGFHFTARSGIEVAFQDVFTRTKIVTYQDTKVHDRIYSINWVQSIFGREQPIQPYFKIGVGQLNRDASGTYELTGTAPTAVVDSITAVLGFGMKINFTQQFAVRGEITSYLDGGNIQTLQDNVSFSLGTSFYF